MCRLSVKFGTRVHNTEYSETGVGSCGIGREPDPKGMRYREGSEGALRLKSETYSNCGKAERCVDGSIGDFLFPGLQFSLS